MLKRVGEQTLRRTWRQQQRVVRRELLVRRFTASSAGAGAKTSTATSAASPLGGLTVELDRIAPRFEVPASNITVLEGPSSFYETLKNKIRHAKTRIYLSTLYVGKTEHELIATLDQALRENPYLKVSVLTDGLRGTRETPNPCSASLLAPLLAKYGEDRVEIRMFHTPNLTGFRKKIVPRRFDEGWGLQHMKLYGIDDEIILSGANLSTDYFTNRLDRYHIFSSKPLSDYYAQIHHAVCGLSFQVVARPGTPAGYELVWPKANGCSSPLDDPQAFISHATSVLAPLIRPAKTQLTPVDPSGRTLVYPVAQFTPLLNPDTSTEFPAVTNILRLLAVESGIFRNSRWMFTAGYFNIHPTLSSLLVESTSPTPSDSSSTMKAQGIVLTASPWANGFYGSPGVSGMLPAAYTHLAARFLDRVAEAQRTHAIQLKEWRRGTVGQPGGWTYHAKGLWITLPNEQYPSLTFIGSSNYTKRSYSLDLEVGALVVTSDEGLKKRLAEETEWLQADASPVSREDFRRTERRVGWNVRLAMWIVEKVGGAL